jgi:hypothetical protein
MSIHNTFFNFVNTMVAFTLGVVAIYIAIWVAVVMMNVNISLSVGPCP